MRDSTYTAFITGEIDFVAGRRIGPDWKTMLDDIERATRAMHNGRLVLNLRLEAPSIPTIVHVHVGVINRSMPARAA